MKIFTTLIRHCVVVLSTLLFLQFPLYIQSYQLQLMGHVEEVEWHVQRMVEMASLSGKSLDQYILKFIENGDEDFSRQGLAMRQMELRAKKMRQALQELKRAHFFMRPMVFLAYADWEIAASTARAFQPGIPLTIEGATYAFMGLILGSLLTALGGRIFLPKLL